MNDFRKERPIQPTTAARLTDKQRRKGRKRMFIDAFVDVMNKMHYRLAHIVYTIHITCTQNGNTV